MSRSEITITSHKWFKMTDEERLKLFEQNREVRVTLPKRFHLDNGKATMERPKISKGFSIIDVDGRPGKGDFLIISDYRNYLTGYTSGCDFESMKRNAKRLYKELTK